MKNINILEFKNNSINNKQTIPQIKKILKKEKYRKNNNILIIPSLSNTKNQLIKIFKLHKKKDNKQINKNLNLFLYEYLDFSKKLIKENSQRKQINEVIKKEIKKIRNELEKINKENHKNQIEKIYNKIINDNEELTALIISRALKNQKINNNLIHTKDFIKIDNNNSEIKVIEKEIKKKFKNYFQKFQNQNIFLIAGSNGSTTDNIEITFNKFGTNFITSTLNIVFKTKEIEIWTNTNGIMSADPSKVQEAFTIPHLSHKEAMEMNYFGKKIIDPKTIKPSLKTNTSIKIKNLFNIDENYTNINNKKIKNDFPIKAITSINEISLLRLEGTGMIEIEGTSGRLFSSLGKNKINIIIISQASSEYSICFAIKKEESEKARKIIQKEFKNEINNKNLNLIVEKDLSIISIVGENMCQTPGISGILFGALGRDGINVIATAQGSSEINVSVVIKKEDEIKALNVIHNSFFLSEYKTLNIFLLGTGLIGQTLLRQIQENESHLKKNHKLKINLIGLGNTKKMIFNQNKINLKKWRKELEKSEIKNNLSFFIKKMKKFNLPHSIFIDCTSSKKISSRYEQIMENNISIVTPNKKANSSEYKLYEKLKKLSSKPSVNFLYETNVGAGLPVISTLHDLIASGDKIIKIEAILSGTISYIFNNFTKNKKFSETVLEAKIKGYTEPDPRDDLDGMDVARKILILAREIGLNIELKDIKIENLINQKCKKIKSIEEFLNSPKSELKTTIDSKFEKLQEKAQKENKVLRYIAKLENNQAEISLKLIDKNHPFYSLNGNENIVSFTTKRYKNTPLVIKGPGSGAEVTSAGVYADIIKTFKKT